MPKNVQVVDRGWGRIKREIAKAKHAAVKIGVQADAGKHQGGVDIVTVAAVNEFGAPRRNIPQRSFIRSTTDEQRETTLLMSAVELERIYDGRSNVKKSLGRLGQFMQDRIIAKINSGIPPPNAESTIRAKEKKVRHAPTPGFTSHKTLVDTGQLKQSIRWEYDRV
jgi:hypothetical protein